MNIPKFVLFFCLVLSSVSALFGQTPTRFASPGGGLCGSFVARMPKSLAPAKVLQDPQGRAILVSALAALTADGRGIPADWEMTLATQYGTETLTKEQGRFDILVGNEHRVSVIDENGDKHVQLSGTQKGVGPDFAFGLLNPVMPQIDLFDRLSEEYYSIDAPKDEVIDGISVVAVETSCRQPRWTEYLSRQRWYFDKSSHLPIRVDFAMESSANQRVYVPATTRFASFTADSGVTHTASATQMIGGVSYSISLNSIEVKGWSQSSNLGGGR